MDIISIFSRRDLVKNKVSVKLKSDFTDLSSVSGLNSPEFIRKRNAMLETFFGWYVRCRMSHHYHRLCLYSK